MNQRLINSHMEKLRKSNRVILDPDALRWTPLVHTNMALIDSSKDGETVHGGEREKKDHMEDTGGREVDVLSSDRKAECAEVINGDMRKDETSAFDDDDEGPIIRPRKRRRSNTLSDSGSEKVEEKVKEEPKAGGEPEADEEHEADREHEADKEHEEGDNKGAEEVLTKRMKVNNEETSEERSEESPGNSDSDDSSSSSTSSSSSSSEDSDNAEPVDDNEGARVREETRKASEDGTSESSSEMNAALPAGDDYPSPFDNHPGNQSSLPGLSDPDIGIDPAFPALSPHFECKVSNPSDNLTTDQDLNLGDDFPDTDSTALIKELSEEVFSIRATPALGANHSSDDDI